MQGFAGLTTPSAPLKGGFAIFLLMSRPPLLCEEGNRRADTVFAWLRQQVEVFRTPKNCALNSCAVLSIHWEELLYEN